MANTKVLITIMLTATDGWEAKYEEVVWKERQSRILAQLLCQIAPSFFRTLSLKGAFLIHWCSTFDHSARHEPAIPGFPVLISRVSSYKGWSRVYNLHTLAKNRPSNYIILICAKLYILPETKPCQNSPFCPTENPSKTQNFILGKIWCKSK